MSTQPAPRPYTAPPAMVDVKESVATANSFLSDLFPAAREVRLEEVALNMGGTTWQVVLSFRVFESNQLAPLSPQGNRTYKQIDVDRISGEARALRGWKPQG